MPGLIWSRLFQGRDHIVIIIVTQGYMLGGFGTFTKIKLKRSKYMNLTLTMNLMKWALCLRILLGLDKWWGFAQNKQCKIIKEDRHCYFSLLNEMNIFYLSMGSWFKFSLTFYLTSLIYFKRHDFDAADCLMKIVKQEGFWSLWNGTAPSILLAANPAIHFMVYESLKRYFQRIFNTSVSTPNTRLGFFSTEDNNRNTASVLLLS